jgi:hypothetical protein
LAGKIAPDFSTTNIKGANHIGRCFREVVTDCDFAFKAPGPPPFPIFLIRNQLKIWLAILGNDNSLASPCPFAKDCKLRRRFMKSDLHFFLLQTVLFFCACLIATTLALGSKPEKSMP